MVSNARTHIENGDIESAGKYLDLVDMYADYHKFEDPRLVSAIRGLAKELDVTEPKALESLAFQGFHDIGRIKALGGMSLIQSEMDSKKQIIIAQILPDFGVKPMTAKEQSEYVEKQLAGKYKRGE